MFRQIINFIIKLLNLILNHVIQRIKAFANNHKILEAPFKLSALSFNIELKSSSLLYLVPTLLLELFIMTLENPSILEDDNLFS